MKSATEIHDFKERIEFSLEGNKNLEAIYRSVWPELVRLEPIEGDCELQRKGVDVILHLESGKKIYIDEKKRGKGYDDICLEVCSVGKPLRGYIKHQEGSFEYQKVGWAMDTSKVCDFVLYYFEDRPEIYLLPFELMRMALAENFEDWAYHPDCSWPIDAFNHGYVTRNICVPWPLLKEGITNQMFRSFG